MQHSESLGELADALAKAQAKIIGASKDAANPFFKSRYADLSSVWEACRGPLSENGLSVTQMPHDIEGKLHLTTLLMHKSGQWLRCDYPVIVAKPNDPQALGSGITYARRYSLSAVVGVAQVDDDGNAAAGKV